MEGLPAGLLLVLGLRGGVGGAAGEEPHFVGVVCWLWFDVLELRFEI